MQSARLVPFAVAAALLSGCAPTGVPSSDTPAGNTDTRPVEMVRVLDSMFPSDLGPFELLTPDDLAAIDAKGDGCSDNIIPGSYEEWHTEDLRMYGEAWPQAVYVVDKAAYIKEIECYQEFVAGRAHMKPGGSGIQSTETYSTELGDASCTAKGCSLIVDGVAYHFTYGDHWNSSRVDNIRTAQTQALVELAKAGRAGAVDPQAGQTHSPSSTSGSNSVASSEDWCRLSQDEYDPQIRILESTNTDNGTPPESDQAARELMQAMPEFEAIVRDEETAKWVAEYKEAFETYDASTGQGRSIWPVISAAITLQYGCIG